MTWLNFNHSFGATGKGQLSQICLQDASSLACLRSWKSHTIKSIVIGTIQLEFGGIEVSWWQWPPSTWRLATAKTKCCKCFWGPTWNRSLKEQTSPWQPFLFSCVLAVFGVHHPPVMAVVNLPPPNFAPPELAGLFVRAYFFTHWFNPYNKAGYSFTPYFFLEGGYVRWLTFAMLLLSSQPFLFWRKPPLNLGH